MVKVMDNLEYAVEYRKGTKWNERPGAMYRYMECKICGQMEKCGEDSTSITCSDCVNEMVEGPTIGNNKSSGRPAGWHFMAEFVDKDGTVFYKGVEQPKLKGTLPPTEIVKKKRLTKKEKEKYKQQAGVRVSKLKKELTKQRWKKDKKIILRKIKYFNRIIKGKFPEGFREKLFDE